MEIRNLQKTGGRSYSITLPKNWIKRNFLKAKDKVKVLDIQNFLVIAPLKLNRNEKFISVDIKNLNQNQIFREIIGYYLSGADSIIIKTDKISYQQRSAVREISFQLIGCECLESLSDKIFLKIVNTDISHHLFEYLKKMSSIIYSMFQDTVRAVEKYNIELSRDIIERDVEIDRLHIAITRFHNLRLINLFEEKNQTLTAIDSHYLSIIGLRLERIADHIVKINRVLIQESQKNFSLSYRQRHLIKYTLKNLSSLSEIIFKKDKVSAHSFLDYFDQKKEGFFHNLPHKNYLALIIEESLFRINSYIANIAEEAINYLNIKDTLSSSLTTSLIE
ncbi:MAG: AbrB/MazE/SpoVT family DNA-binding domain-containing protein [Patescibacteria group bacterium]|nr:AbrB/MazE/SpoVT family DNA-binding domain-containing protein [Patescibacteria group bacterium]